MFESVFKSDENKLHEAVNKAREVLKSDKAVLKKQKRTEQNLKRISKYDEVEIIFNKYEPKYFDSICNAVKSRNDRFMILQDLPFGIIENARIWNKISKLRSKDVKKYIKSQQLTKLKTVIKQELSLGFRNFDILDKMVERGWNPELAKKLLK